jgi:hypothetical protein
MPSGDRVNAELAALGDMVPDVPDHVTALGLGDLAGPRGVVDEIPAGAGQSGDAGGVPKQSLGAARRRDSATC